MSTSLTMSGFLGALTLSAAVIAGCGWQIPPQQRPTLAASADERIRVAVLDTIAGRIGTASLVLSGMTWALEDPVADVIVERARDQFGQQGTLLADFRARAAAEVDLRVPNGTEAEIVIAPPAELVPREGESAEGFWQRFREVQAPSTGWVRITDAGLDETRSSAMIAAEYTCGARCGWGVLYRLSSVADGWLVVDEVILWIS